MEKIIGRIRGDVTIAKDTHQSGIIDGAVMVTEKAVFELHGMVTGEVTIEEGATVYLRGTVNGDVVNNGGRLEVIGIANARVIRNGGETIIDPDATVRDGLV